MNAILLVLVASALWPFGHEGRSDRRRYLIPAWHIETEQDRFTGRTVCRVFQGRSRRPDVSFARGTLAFAFPRGRNTLGADFRIDQGPVRPWTDVTPSLVAAGATLENGSMTNPTGGYVMLPASLLADASTVTIRSRPQDRPKTFSVGGLRDAVSAARRQGCDLDHGFSRADQ